MSASGTDDKSASGTDDMSASGTNDDLWMSLGTPSFQHWETGLKYCW